MKKYLFCITTAFAAVSSLYAQALVKVGADTNVRVKENTLFYIGGNINVAKYTATDKKILNEGNVRVTGSFANSNTNGGNFVDAISGPGKYGQLIITGMGGNTGKITSQVKLKNANFNFQTIAIPYTGITAQELVKEAFAGTPSFVSSSADGVYDANRYKNPIFAWNNEDYRLDNLVAGYKLNSPTSYYTLSTFAGDLKNEVANISGVPNKEEITINVNGYSPRNSKFVNGYGEAYGSYIVDFTQAPPTGWGDFAEEGQGVTSDYGSNIYYFGNPYTSNIDISKGEGFSGNNIVLYQEASNIYNTDLKVAASSYSAVMAATAQGAGDPVFGVRPLQTFGVKVPGLIVGSSHTFKFSHAMKTFDINPAANNVLYNKKRNTTVKINQVGLDLYDAEGNNTGNRIYVVASNIYEASQKGKGQEVYNVSISEENTGIYTLQETEDGNIDENLMAGKTYINGVNADKYVGKPIHLVFQNGKGHYTIKARLNDDLLNNKNKFYFEDKATGKIVKINKDFEYSFDVQGTDKDRFVLYWAATPKADLDKEVAKEEVNNTVIYKDGASYKVRFDNSMKRADVFVYNISGQLINIVKGVNTTEDYIVPIQGNASIYVVKVVGDNGKVITKKIIK